MKRFLLILSLASNAMLIGWIALGRQEAIALPTPHTQGAEIRVVPNAAAAPVSAGDLASMAPADLVKWLRAAQLPEPTIRSVVIAVLGEPITRRSLERMAAAPRQPYWRSTAVAGNDLAYQASELEDSRLRRELAEKVSALLGPPPEPSGVTAALARAEFGSLPAGKVQLLQLLDREFLVKGFPYAARDGIEFPGDKENRTRLAAERDSAIRELLDADEYEQYAMFRSPSAASLRGRLQGFEPTDSEYRTLFAMQQAFDQRWTNPVDISGDVASRKIQGEAELNAAIRAALAPERRAELERVNSYQYGNILEVTRRLKLPDEVARQIWTINENRNRQADAIRDDPALDEAAQSTRIEALGREALSSVQKLVVDPKGLRALKSNLGGGWLETVE